MQFMTHNFVLIPDDICAEKITNFAQINFAAIADDYLLTPQKDLPHITICQFNTTDEIAEKICSQLPEFEYYPEFLSFVCHASGPAEDKLWCDIMVKKTQELLDIQRTVFEALRVKNIQPLTLEADAYRPHLTLARIHAQQIYPSIKTPNFLKQKENGFRFALCRSDKVGQVVEVLES